MISLIGFILALALPVVIGIPQLPKTWREPAGGLTIGLGKPPEVVLTTTGSSYWALAGLTDPRVLYWEPAKWIARLRRLCTDDNLIAFRTNLDAGHAGAAGRFDRLKEVALAYAFAIKVARAAP
jgi:oligopeptidase B